jgi:uncharacterized HAD superfamily protein/phosphoribosyl-ATP pyrophosphohydrolase
MFNVILKYSDKKCEDLQSIWEDQADFNKYILPCSPELMDKEQKQYWTNLYALCLHKEVSEALDETPYKPHRKGKEIIKSNLTEELVDIMKYWICLCQVHDVTADDIIEEYNRKSNVVRQRFFQEKVLNYDNVIGVDIDGVLADYPRSFIEFINKEMKTNYDYKDIKSYDIAESLSLPPEECAKLKNLYRETGQKRFIPVIDGAKQFLEELKYLGYTIVLLTSRPYDKYKRMFGDTQYWLVQNKMMYDAILWDEKKGERLIEEFGKDKVKLFIDDVASFANNIGKLGMKCILLNKPYNLNISTHENVMRVNSLREALNEISRFNQSEVMLKQINKT